MDAFQDRERAESFGEDAERYDRARPGYPDALVDDVLAGGVRTVLDVGCGTGISSKGLRSRGAHVVGVEVDERMAVVARRHGLAVEVSRFESWDAGGRTFDALVCGQAWHWVDPVLGPRKAADVLRPGGRAVAFWNGVDHDPDVMAAFREVYERHEPALLEHSVALGTLQPERGADVSSFASSGRFVEPIWRTYRWRRAYTTGSWLDELATHSAYGGLEPQRRDRLFAAIAEALDARGGHLVPCFRTSALFVTRR